MKRTLSIVLCLLLALACTVGCASKAADSYGNYRADSYYENSYTQTYEAPAEAESAGFSTNIRITSSSDANAALANRKIIRNADLSVQTLAFDTFIEKLNDLVASFGGFIESSSVSGRTLRNSTQLRNAYFTIRVPADQLDAFLNSVSELGNVTSKNTSLRDVTTNYVDSEKHLEALRTEQKALLEILAKAETVEDIITVQDRLAEVRYEIESYESILRTYDDQIDLSTVSLNLCEVEHETPVEEETFGQEVSRRFKESMETVGDGFRAFGAWLFGEAPEIIVTLLILGGIALIIVLIVRGSIKRSRKRRQQRAEALAAMRAQQAAAQSENNRG